jgi:hypothetical protein
MEGSYEHNEGFRLNVNVVATLSIVTQILGQNHFAWSTKSTKLQ